VRFKVLLEVQRLMPSGVGDTLCIRFGVRAWH